MRPSSGRPKTVSAEQASRPPARPEFFGAVVRLRRKFLRWVPDLKIHSVRESGGGCGGGRVTPSPAFPDKWSEAERRSGTQERSCRAAAQFVSSDGLSGFA